MKQTALLFLILSIVARVAIAQPTTVPASVPTATQPTTQPTTAPTYLRGVVMSVYKLPRQPGRIEQLLPGQTPDDVSVLTSLKADRADFHGFEKNVQAEVSGEFYANVRASYEFDAMTDGGLELSIDDQLVLLAPYAPTNDNRVHGKMNLEPGWHPIRVAFCKGDAKIDGGMHFDIRVHSSIGDEPAEVSADSLRIEQASVDTAKASVGKSPDATDKPWRSVYKSPGFGGITEDEAECLTELLEGPTQVSKAARDAWPKLEQSCNYAKLSPIQETMVLAGFLRGWFYEETTRAQPLLRATYTLSEPEKIDHFPGWRGADRRGVKYLMTIDGRTLDIYMPMAGLDETNSVPKAVAGLPLYLRQLITTIHVEPYGTAHQLETNRGDIWLRTQGPALLKLLDSVFAHEIGHSVMDKTSCEGLWFRAVSLDTMSVSQYGRTNIHEDFAEFFRLYLAANNNVDQLRSLRILYPNRMRVLEAVVKKVGGPE